MYNSDSGKLWFDTKKWKNSILKKKKSKGPFEVGTAGKKISVFQNFNFFFEKWLQWEVATVENQTGMKFELISSIHWGITRDHLHGGVGWPPPPSM